MLKNYIYKWSAGWFVSSDEGKTDTTTDNGTADPAHGPQTPSVLLLQPNPPLVESSGPLEPLDPSLVIQTKLAELTVAPKHPNPSSDPTAPSDSIQDPTEDQNKPRPIRDGGLIAAKKTFQAVEIFSGMIPGFGDVVGAGAKAGLGIVNMIEVKLTICLFIFSCALT